MICTYIYNIYIHENVINRNVIYKNVQHIIGRIVRLLELMFNNKEGYTMFVYIFSARARTVLLSSLKVYRHYNVICIVLKGPQLSFI